MLWFVGQWSCGSCKGPQKISNRRFWQAKPNKKGKNGSNIQYDCQTFGWQAIQIQMRWTDALSDSVRYISWSMELWTCSSHLHGWWGQEGTAGHSIIRAYRGRLWGAVYRRALWSDWLLNWHSCDLVHTVSTSTSSNVMWILCEYEDGELGWIPSIERSHWVLLFVTFWYIQKVVALRLHVCLSWFLSLHLIQSTIRFTILRQD